MKKSIKSARPEGSSQKSAGEIRFYRSNEKPYGAFSNLYPRPIEFDGRIYPTTEHAYQAGKASKPAVREWILSAPTPALAAMAAHGLYTWDVVPNWAQIKFDRMRAVLRAKFSQHDDLRDLLLSTGTMRLVEAGTVNNAVNRLWGEVDGKGENMLGVMLMELREELSMQYAQRTPTASQRIMDGEERKPQSKAGQARRGGVKAASSKSTAPKKRIASKTVDSSV
ncbi:NADAR family protein [Burkholderia sp. MSMB1826]|uniref:NADAR family protein n=1 Tax=Burkholderia sp. MSMB1826 TaxID=1637875 RepID=UPI0009E8D191|nr:NADAR family protein [Burkholderia sp. MSMB1826]